MESRLAILLFIVLAFPTFGEGFGEGRNLSDCAENFDTLEWALVHTKNNKVELRKAFYPPREEASDFVTVHYKFLDEDGMNITCKKTWLWSTIGFYLIQPPTIYQFMALFFNPEPRVSTADILLPYECRDLVTWENGSCSCDSNGTLDIITQQVSPLGNQVSPNCHMCYYSGCHCSKYIFKQILLKFYSLHKLFFPEMEVFKQLAYLFYWPCFTLFNWTMDFSMF